MPSTNDAKKSNDASVPQAASALETTNTLPISSFLRSSSTSSSSSPTPEQQQWDTKNLGWRLASDGIAAASAGVLVAPLITMIDRGIIETAAKGTPLSASILSSARSFLFRPHRFLASTPFLLISLLYTSTYITANTIDTVSSAVSSLPPTTTTSGPTKFLATTAVNMSVCLYKDAQFARMFGKGTSRGPMPGRSFAIFAARDAMTIFASFNVPPLIAPYLPIEDGEGRVMSSQNVAQFLTPAAVQFFSTPLHLWGLDYYNRPSGQGSERIDWRNRFNVVSRDWLKCSFARMGRIVPAFGVGGVVNREVRARLIESRT
ncbi:MAG: hypothetical protein M1834_000070 [Cirrosporium novae-zelandiae]|nr:MAG: hypothetical protein M1834_000070 [Cirrosporium novae-zelandiae]